MRISMITELQRSVSENGLVDFEATYRESLEQARAADEAGFHTMWITEHHFLPTFSVAPASDQFLAAVAAQTKNLRVGTGEGEGDAWDRLSPEALAESGITIAGTPDQCIEALKLYEENDVDEVLLLLQNEETPHHVSMETIRQFGEHVIPEFR